MSMVSPFFNCFAAVTTFSRIGYFLMELESKRPRFGHGPVTMGALGAADTETAKDATHAQAESAQDCDPESRDRQGEDTPGQRSSESS